MHDKVYSIKEAAELLGISRAYVYYLKNTGKIKTKKIGSQYTITQKEIDRYRQEANEPSNNNS